VGLVLGGGGVLGQAFHAGVLVALAEAGWDPRDAEVIVGTSAGSQIGALLRAGVSAADLAAGLTGREVSPAGAAVLDPVRAQGRIAAPAPPRRGRPGPGSLPLLARLLIRPWRVRPGLLLAGAAPPGRRATDGFVAGLEPVFREDWPEAPLWIPAIRLHDGARVVFGRPGAPSASVGQAVAASCAVPAFFAPPVIGGTRYVDGGCGSATNLDLAAGAGLDLVVVSSPLSLARVAPLRGVCLPARLLHRVELAFEAFRVRRSGIAVIAFEPDPSVQAAMGRNSMDYSRVPVVVEAARRSGNAVAAHLVTMGL
jgi:NTE family protein